MGKLALGLATLAGLSLAAFLTAREGVADVAGTVASAGYGIALVVLAHLVQVLFSALGWHAVMGRGSALRLGTVVRLRWIRESISNLLPMTQVGGEVVAVRLLTLRGGDPARATASILIDITLELVTQILFTIGGLLLFLSYYNDAPAAGPLVYATMLLSVLAMAFVLAQRQGLWLHLERMLESLAERLSALQSLRVPGLHAAVAATYADRRTILRSCCWHLASWIAGAVEIWLAMLAIGAPGGFTEALIIESLSQAARSAAFMIPGGLGVQEGSYLLLGSLLGISPEAALGLSFIKRVRELILGAPGLLAWYVLEGQHAWRRRRAAN